MRYNVAFVRVSGVSWITLYTYYHCKRTQILVVLGCSGKETSSYSQGYVVHCVIIVHTKLICHNVLSLQSLYLNVNISDRV